MSVRTHLSSLVVGLVGGLIGASLVGGGIAYAANGGYLVLGASNTETRVTTLTNSYGTALALRSKTTTAPFTVNSAVKVPYLNADRLDGIDSTAFALASGKVAFVLTSGGGTIDWNGDGTDDAVWARATCPAGTSLMSGGYDIDPGNVVLSSSPYNDNSWYVVTDTTSSTIAEVYAVCWNPRGAVTGGTNVLSASGLKSFASGR